MTVTLCSIQVGMPTERVDATPTDGETKTWISGIYKSPVQGPIRVGRVNLDGDGQADLRYHGGLDRPILAYSAEHYTRWQSERGLELPHGAFGENFTVSGADEHSVCLGDKYRVGDVLVEVSQPRGPCWKLARRVGIPGFAADVLRLLRTGWYMRVLEEGTVETGMTLSLTDRPCPEWTIARAHTAQQQRKSDVDTARALGACPYLSADWKAALSSL